MTSHPIFGEFDSRIMTAAAAGAIAIIGWAISLEVRLEATISNEVGDRSAHEQMMRDLSSVDKTTSERLDRIDQNGTRALQITETEIAGVQRDIDNLSRVISRLDSTVNANSGRISVLESRVNRIEQPTP